MLSLYIFPLLSVLKKMLVKIKEDQEDEFIVITPSCLRRSWYHFLLQMAYEIPLLLPCRRDILSQHLPDKGTLYHTC